MNKQKIVIFLTVFIDVVGFGIVIPTMPLYVSQFGASAFISTIFFAVYALFQFISSPILGAISDKIGRRPVLIVSLFGTSLGWFVFALANSLPLLFLGRILDGITGGNISTAQSYLVDISKDKKERTANLGLIGAAFGIGFIMGPALGAFLSHFGNTIPFICSGVLALLNTIAAIMFLPETNLNPDKNKKISLNPFQPIIKGLKNKNISAYLIAWFLIMLSITIQQSVFTLFLNKQFNYTEVQSGYFLAIVGLIVVLNQGFFLKKVWLKYFKEPQLEFGAIIAMALFYSLFTINSLAVFIIALIGYSFAHSVIRVVTNSQIVGAAKENERGEVIGVTQGFTSLAAIIMPPISGYVFELNIYYPWFLASIIVIIAGVFVLVNREKLRKAKLAQTGNAIWSD